MRGSNSHGRSQSPLHYHYANPHRVCVLGVCPQRSYIIACSTGFVNAFFEKTSIFSPKFSVFQNSSLLRQSFSVIRCRWISLPAGGTFIPWAIPHNSKCRYVKQGYKLIQNLQTWVLSAVLNGRDISRRNVQDRKSTRLNSSHPSSSRMPSSA